MTDPRPFGTDVQLIEPVAGAVWRAWWRGGEGQFMVKLVALSTSDRAIDERIAMDQAALVAVRHPNLVPVLALVRDDSALAIVMEAVSGPSLKAELKRSGTAPAAEAARLIAYTCVALAVLHSQGLFHRDLRPAKVLLDPVPGEGPTPRVTDFATARLSDGPDRACSLRTEPDPDYVAPEVLAGRPPGPEADVYAAGTMLYELLAGHTPFSGLSMVGRLRAQAESPPPTLPVAAPLWSTLSAMLAKDPGQRPTARDAALALADLAASDLADLPLPDVPTPPPAVPAPGAPEPRPGQPAPDSNPTVALPIAARRVAAPEPGATVIRQRVVPVAATPEAPPPHGLRRLFHRKPKG